MAQNDQKPRLVSVATGVANRTLAAVVFNLDLPAAAPKPEALSVNAQLAAACLMILRHEPVGRLSAEQERTIDKNAEELGVETPLYLASVAAGWREAHPGEHLPANSAAGPWAVRQVEAHRQTAAERYGYFDTQAISALTQQAEPAALLNSERLACQQVVGGRLKGYRASVTRLYEDRELGLDPAWLATEPTYWRWLSRQDDEDAEFTPPSAELRKHRRRAGLCLKHAGGLAAARSRFCAQVLTDCLAVHKVAVHRLNWPDEVRSLPVLWLEAADVAASLITKFTPTTHG